MRPVSEHLKHILYSAFIAGPHRIGAPAGFGGPSADLLYKLCSGERHLLAEYLPGIYRATGDVVLFAELSGATACGLVVTRAPAAAEVVTDSRRSSACKVAAGAGRVAELVDAAEADGLVTDAERDAIEAQLDELERKAESLRQLLRAVRVA